MNAETGIPIKEFDGLKWGGRLVTLSCSLHFHMLGHNCSPLLMIQLAQSKCQHLTFRLPNHQSHETHMSGIALSFISDLAMGIL